MKADRLVMLVMLASVCTGVYSQTVEQPQECWSRGPLVGKNWYLPFSIYYHYPGYSARPGKQAEFQYHVSHYYTNDYYSIFSAEYRNSLMQVPPEEHPSSFYISRDYESYNVELGFSYWPLRRLAFGLDVRLVSYFGGILDLPIEEFHRLLDLPNGFRELSARNQVLVDIQNASGVSLALNRPAASLGDIDLHARYTFLETAELSLAGYCALKLPTGQRDILSGSGYPDAALGIVADYLPARFVALYGHAGMTVPFDAFIAGAVSRPKPFFVGMAGVEIAPIRKFSIQLQLNIKSPTLEPSISDDLHWIFTASNMLLLPQANVLAGCSLGTRDALWQCYLEEDSFTGAGADITFNLAYFRTIKRQPH